MICSLNLGRLGYYFEALSVVKLLVIMILSMSKMGTLVNSYLDIDVHQLPDQNYFVADVQKGAFRIKFNTSCTFSHRELKDKDKNKNYLIKDVKKVEHWVTNKKKQADWALVLEQKIPTTSGAWAPTWTKKDPMYPDKLTTLLYSWFDKQLGSFAASKFSCMVWDKKYTFAFLPKDKTRKKDSIQVTSRLTGTALLPLITPGLYISDGSTNPEKRWKVKKLKKGATATDYAITLVEQTRELYAKKWKDVKPTIVLKSGIGAFPALMLKRNGMEDYALSIGDGKDKASSVPVPVPTTKSGPGRGRPRVWPSVAMAVVVALAFAFACVLVACHSVGVCIGFAMAKSQWQIRRQK